MNMLQRVFNYNGQRVRTVLINNEPWFVGKDVCSVLELGNVSQSLSRLDDDEKDIISNDTPGGLQDLLCINEPGLYSLVLSCRKPEAKLFKRWITHDVIPAIRKNGIYAKTEDEIILLGYKALMTKVDKLEAENKKLLPKAKFFDQVASSKKAVDMGEAAKVLNIKGLGRTKLFEFLRQNKVLTKDNIPYQKYIDLGYFRVIEQKWNTRRGETQIYIKTLVYQRGLNFILRLYNKKLNKEAV